MKRKLPDYKAEERKVATRIANAQAERNAAMGFIMFVIGVIMLLSFLGSLVR